MLTDDEIVAGVAAWDALIGEVGDLLNLARVGRRAFIGAQIDPDQWGRLAYVANLLGKHKQELTGLGRYDSGDVEQSTVDVRSQVSKIIRTVSALLGERDDDAVSITAVGFCDMTAQHGSS